MSLLGTLPPGAFLALLLGTLYGSLGHLVLGRRFWHLPMYLLVGIVSCLVPWALKVHLLHRFPAPGGLPIVEASVVAWLLLTIVAMLRRS